MLFATSIKVMFLFVLAKIRGKTNKGSRNYVLQPKSYTTLIGLFFVERCWKNVEIFIPSWSLWIDGHLILEVGLLETAEVEHKRQVVKQKIISRL